MEDNRLVCARAGERKKRKGKKGERYCERERDRVNGGCNPEVLERSTFAITFACILKIKGGDSRIMSYHLSLVTHGIKPFFFS